MPGHKVRAECGCGFQRSLRPGSAWIGDGPPVGYSMAYNTDGTDLLTERNDVIQLQQCRTIADPFLLKDHGTFEDFLEERRKLNKPQGPYLCPQCTEVSLNLHLEGLWN